jgi:uncharacterized protein (TIGR02145 family)
MKKYMFAGAVSIISAVLCVTFLALNYYRNAHADTSITVNILTGTIIKDETTLTVSKGSCTSFTLKTYTKTANNLGYTISAYVSGVSGSTIPSGISIKKSDNATTISTSASSPTEVIKTTAADTTLDNTSTNYYACADSGMSSGTYNVDLAYNIAENVVTYPRIGANVAFQDTTANRNQTCSALTTFTGTNTGVLVHMVDDRDGKYYWVGRLADGKCWMLQNLMLGAGAYGGSGSKTASSTKFTLANGGSQTYSSPQYQSPSGTSVGDYTVSSPLPSTPTKSYGYLYNWCAAMGGQSTACASGLINRVTSDSICASGWKMPTLDDYKKLNGYMAGLGAASTDSSYYANWIASASSPFRGTFPGGFDSNYIFNTGTYAYLWTSSPIASGSISSGNVANIDYEAGSVNFSSANSNRAYTVRCFTD